jgi:hypothetical protein
MSEPTEGTEGQAPVAPETETPNTQPAPERETRTAEPETTPETPEEEAFDKERALHTIRQLREAEKVAKKQAADHAKRVAEYEQKDRERAEAEMTERDRLAAQLDRATAELQLERQQNRDAINRYEVERSAAKLNIVDPEAAVKLLDWGSLEYDTDGRPIDVDAALTALVEAKPYLIKATETPAAKPRAAANPTNPATRTQAPGQRIYTMAEFENYPFYQANKADMEAAMREGRIART